MRRFRVLSFVVFCSVLLTSARGFCSEVSVERALELLQSRSFYDQGDRQEVLDRAASDPAFRKQLVDRLTSRLLAYEEDFKGDSEVLALIALEATEALPQLQQKWRQIAKRTYYQERVDPRIQMLIAISQFLPASEGIQFLIDTQQDVEEASTVRFRAMVLLCASGDEKAIAHVLSILEAAKQRHGRTTSVSIERQNANPPRPQDWDQDADLMTEYAEIGLLLDPNNKDTDGDGLLDGNDRNPLCAGTDTPSADQQIAQTLLLLHTLSSSRPDSVSMPNPSQPNVLIANTAVDPDQTRPSPMAGIEFLGIDGIVLHLDAEGMRRYTRLHGYGTPRYSIHPMGVPSESERQYRFTRYLSPMGAEMHVVTLRRFNGIWLPIAWELRGMA